LKQKKLAEPSPAEDNKTVKSSSLIKANHQSLAAPAPQSPNAKTPTPGIVRGVDTFFGSNFTDVVNQLLRELRLVFSGAGTPDDEVMTLAFRLMGEIGPKDQLEALLAVQMLGTHNLAMRFLARAVVEGQTVDGVNMNVDRATKLLRTFAVQLEALKRHRSKGTQRVIVKHVNVHEGGQAIVGAVSHNSKGGGGNDTDV
jgi:hypothetical protein